MLVRRTEACVMHAEAYVRCCDWHICGEIARGVRSREGKRDTLYTSMRIRCVRLRIHDAPVFKAHVRRACACYDMSSVRLELVKMCNFRG